MILCNEVNQNKRWILKIVAIFYFLLVLRLTKCQVLERLDPEFQDINEMFPSFTKSSNTAVLTRPPGVIVRNISIDLEKIDMDKFRRKLEGYMHKITDFDKIEANLTGRGNETRRMKFQEYDIGRDEWGRAQEHIVKTKALDMALQVIYMARHKIRQLENMRYFNRHDTSYRIAFLYRRLRKLWKKMMDIYTSMKKKADTYRYYKFQWIEPYLILHHKAAIIHVDFVYMWWVLVNLHEKYRLRHYIPNTTPSTKPTTNATTTTKPP